MGTDTIATDSPVTMQTSCTQKTNIVVIAVGESQQAHQALQYYFEHIYREGHQLVLAHVIELPPAQEVYRCGEAYLTSPSWTEFCMKASIKSRQLEEKFCNITKEKGLASVKVHTEGGINPGETIVKIALKEKATMIVTGCRGMGLIRRTILGSVSDYVLQHAHCPVVVCRHIDNMIRH